MMLQQFPPSPFAFATIFIHNVLSVTFFETKKKVFEDSCLMGTELISRSCINLSITANGSPLKDL